MNFSHTEDRRMLADSLGRLVAEEYPFEHRNQVAYSPDGRSAALHAKLAELGAIAALFPEEAGGLGGTGFDISLVFECLGRGLVGEPLLGALVVGRALALAGTAAQRALLEGIMAGATLPALAHDEPGGHYESSLVSTTAVRAGDGWMIQGAKSVVEFGDSADLLLVSARSFGGVLDREGISLFLVPGETPGIERQGYARIDGGRAAEVRFEQVRVGRGALLGVDGQGMELLERIRGYGALALAAEALGAMDVAKDHTLEYLRTRKQFGGPIGRFQALQHRMADLLLEVEQARSAVINAAAAMDGNEPVARDKAVSAAKFSTGRIGVRVAEEAIQMHGGIGMTWELPLAHYAKRLVMIDHQFGDEDYHLARYIALCRTQPASA